MVIVNFQSCCMVITTYIFFAAPATLNARVVSDAPSTIAFNGQFVAKYRFQSVRSRRHQRHKYQRRHFYRRRNNRLIFMFIFAKKC